MGREYVNPCVEIWMGSGRTLEGSRRLEEGDYVALENGIFIRHASATHKVLGTFGSAFTAHHVMLLDVITGEPNIIELI